MDARAGSAIEDVQRAVDALTVSRPRYLGREQEPRWAVVPSLLQQLADAAGLSSEAGPGGSGKPGSRPPVDLDAVDLFRALGRAAADRCALAGLRPRLPDLTAACRCTAPAGQCAVFRSYGLACCSRCRHPSRGEALVAAVAGNLRQLAAYARTIAATDYPALEQLAVLVEGWRVRVAGQFPEERTSRDLPDLTCARCRRHRIPADTGDGRRLLVPTLHYVPAPVAGVACRGCGHLYAGDGALRALAAWQDSERAGAA